MEMLLSFWLMIKPFLPVAAYVLPCIGFVIFLIKQSIAIRRWEDRRENGRIGLTAVELDNLGGVMHGEVKKARCDTFIELIFVSLGAACGIASLYL